MVDGVWTRTYVDVAGQHLEYVNEYRVPAANRRPGADRGPVAARAYYGPAVAGHVVDFARAVWRARGSQQAAADLAAAGFEYTDRQALDAAQRRQGGSCTWRSAATSRCGAAG